MKSFSVHGGPSVPTVATVAEACLTLLSTCGQIEVRLLLQQPAVDASKFQRSSYCFALSASYTYIHIYIYICTHMCIYLMYTYTYTHTYRYMHIYRYLYHMYMLLDITLLHITLQTFCGSSCSWRQYKRQSMLLGQNSHLMYSAWAVACRT